MIFAAVGIVENIMPIHIIGKYKTLIYCKNITFYSSFKKWDKSKIKHLLNEIKSYNNIQKLILLSFRQVVCFYG